MSRDILAEYIKKGGKFASIDALLTHGALKREMYNVTDDDWAKYVNTHKNDDFVEHYI
jgi:hypothetical protein